MAKVEVPISIGTKIDCNLLVNTDIRCQCQSAYRISLAVGTRCCIDIKIDQNGLVNIYTDIDLHLIMITLYPSYQFGPCVPDCISIDIKYLRWPKLPCLVKAHHKSKQWSLSNSFAAQQIFNLSSLRKNGFN